MNKQELKNILSRNTDKCLIKLNDLIEEGDDVYNDYLVLRKKYFNGKSAVMKGTLSFDKWDTHNNQITDSLLILIDKIFEREAEKNSQNAKTDSNEILTAISWLKDSILGVGYEYTTKERYHDRIKKIVKQSQTVTKFEVYDDGSFELKVETKLRRKDYVERDNSLYLTVDLDMESLTTGNLRDIASVEIIELKKTQEGYRIYSSAHEEEQLFNERFKSVNKSWEKKYDEVHIDEDSSTSNDYSFVFDMDNLGLAKRIKNCIEYLAIYFKERKNIY